MTEKELRKLKRGDFLQLLLAQGKDMVALQARLDETTESLEQVRTANERLKADLAEKNALIEKFKGRLNTKDATINALRQEIADLMASRLSEPESDRSAPPLKKEQKITAPQPARPSSLSSKLMQAIKPVLRLEQLQKPSKK